jgi:N-acetylglucosaminyldiphosphoundecaprenol N-acetyl-beta-D-mannosaminyltransferase
MPITYILGTKIDDVSLKEAIDKIAAFLLTGEKGYITTPNPEICLLGYNNKAYRRILNNSSISIPDGFGLKVGAKILNTRLNNTTTGIDLCAEVIKLAEQKKYSVLILGGTQETGERTISLYSYKYPKLKLTYLNGGKFNQLGISDQTDLISQINAINPDITFVCLGAPKQEYFMANNLNKIHTKLMLGVGGSIDFLGQQIKRAPQSWRRFGLEWLWRLIQEPWRWKRITKAVIIFPLACLAWKFGNYFIYRKNVAAMIINKDKQILIGLSRKYNSWQLPQGGVKKNETLEGAVLREGSDEIGSNKLEILSLVKNCYKYKFKPEHYYVDKFHGQRQSLFLLRFNGTTADLNPSPEFTDFQWANKDDIIDKVTPFKQAIIKIGLNKFKDFL